jgi:hypothetical protein
MKEITGRILEEMRAGRVTDDTWVNALEGLLIVLEGRGYDVRGKTMDEIKGDHPKTTHQARIRWQRNALNARATG